MHDYIEVADKITAAFTAKSPAGFGALYADDILVWHNTDQQSQTKAQNLESIGAFFAMAGEVQYSAICRTATENGFIQEHMITGTFADGRPMPPTPACLIITIADGLITRLNEYVDPARMIAAISGG